MNLACDTCALYFYDEEEEEWICDAAMDEDDYGRLLSGHYKECPFYQNGDEYRIARKQ